MKRRHFLSIPAALAAGSAYRARAEENPHFKPLAQVEEIFRDLSQPLHSRFMRDRTRTVGADEADVSAGYSLRLDAAFSRGLDAAIADFNRFMSVSMGVQRSDAGYVIDSRMGSPEGCPASAPEAFHLSVSGRSCRITARDTAGIRRAWIYLEDEMLARGGPFLPRREILRWSIVEDRITHSPVATYRWLSGWELEHDREYYPDEYLNKLAHCGMNGIWVAGLLSRMIASKTLPELGPPRHRLDKLKRLAERTRRYGIKTWLFCIEPRALPPDHPVLAAHPEIRGAEGRALCVSTPLVQAYIREVMRELFTGVPDLAGVINIFKGERATTCWTTERFARTCPRCKHRSMGEVLGDDLNCFVEGMREANPTARLVAWGYSGNDATGVTSFLPYLDRQVIWMGNFEHGGEKTVHGKRVEVQEYSLSSIGPSSTFADVTRQMTQDRRTVYAKLQLGNTYELSTVAYVPAPRIIYDKLAAMHALGVKGAMMSWIIGGYPSAMLKVAGEASFTPLAGAREVLVRAATASWGPRQAPRVADAWDQFARAFQLYLCAYQVFYYGPITRCPAYQLHLEKEPRTAQPYNWGLTRDRVVQPFEDQVSRWRGAFTSDELIASFREMADEWNKGLSILDDCAREESNIPDLRRQCAVAAAARLQFLSMANVLEFYTLRDKLLQVDAGDRPSMLRRMRDVTLDDIHLAGEMKQHVALDCTIGFESEIYDYSYSEPTLDAKIAHDRSTAATLERWEQEGIDTNILNAVLPAPPPEPRSAPTWREWLKWGD